jgi:hypothetical protein
MEVIRTPEAPEAIGPYSQAIRTGRFLYLSGQIPLDPVTMEVVEGGIEAQTEQVYRNMKAVLAAAGASLAGRCAASPAAAPRGEGGRGRGCRGGQGGRRGRRRDDKPPPLPRPPPPPPRRAPCDGGDNEPPRT